MQVCNFNYRLKVFDTTEITSILYFNRAIMAVETLRDDELFKMRKSHRVVVTGMGAVTPLGLNVEESWQGLIEGRSGVQKISTSSWEFKEDARNSEIDIAGLVTGFDASQLIPRKELNRIHRSAQFAVVACREALIQAGLFDPSLKMEKGLAAPIGINPDRLGAILGTGIGGGSIIADIEDVIRDKGDLRVSPFSMLLLLPERVSTVPSMWLNFEAEVGEKTAACASAAQAITDAYRVLERGEADVMLAGGSEAAVHRVALASFNNMHALNNTSNGNPDRASSPFDQKAAGFIMGEGAGILCLETLEHARGRGADILAELVGYGNTADAHHDTAPYLLGAIKAIRKALAMAEIDPAEIDYINAHGTSTPTNDPNELKAFREVFGDNLVNIPVSSTKSATGHLLGAAGGVEAIFSIKAIEEGIIPPTLNLHNPIPEAEGLNLVSLGAQKREVNIVMSDSLGFGGLNSVLIFRKFQRSYERAV